MRPNRHHDEPRVVPNHLESPAEFREFAGISPPEFLATRLAEGSGNNARVAVAAA